MKKIGILYGMENTFPHAFVTYINDQNIDGIRAEGVSIDQVKQAEPTDYAVIIDRISQDVPFYKAFLKNAALCGAAVINNPFWWSADEKFFNNCLAEKIGVPVPKTVLLPSHERPTDTHDVSFRNLKSPLAWEEMFNYIGFPAYMKPHSGGGWKSVYKVWNPEDLWQKHGETGQLVMMLQEEIEFDDYFRCYCIGQKDVLIMPYEPRNPFHERYTPEMNTKGEAGEKLLKVIHDYTLRLNKALGYDFNTVEFAVRDGIPIAIDFCNPAPDADIHSVGQKNFDWVVQAAGNMAIERAQNQKEGLNNLTWGTFIKSAVMETPVADMMQEKPAKKAAPADKKATPAKKAAPAKKAVPAAKKGEPTKAAKSPKKKETME